MITNTETGFNSSNSKAFEFTEEMGRDIVHNAMSMRSDLMRKFMDPRRDYDKECGYPLTENITVQDYKRAYDRDPIAARVVDVLPDECWKVQPTVYEDEDTTSVTAFEEAWDNLGKSLKGGSFYQDEEGSPIWEHLNRLDRLCGIGAFGVLLLGLNDLQQGETLSKPVRGFENQYQDQDEEQDQSPLERQYADNETDYTGSDSLTSPQENSKGPEELKLLFMRVFDESLIQVTRYESSTASARYGQPVLYTLTFVNPIEQAKGGIGLPIATQTVHWTRIIHVADNCNSSEVFGTPRMQTVWNRILDLTKLYGGSAEMYWKGAFPGISLNIDPKMGGDIAIDQDGIRDAMWKYTNSLQRWFALAGVTASSLSPQVVDPTQQINVQTEAICVKLAIPKRIFMGSERGELASSQDAGSWNDRLIGRQKTFITPKLIIPFVDRLIHIGVLPEPEGYSVSWPEVGTNQAAKIANGVAILGGLGTYVSMGLESVIELQDVYVRLFGMKEEEVRAILENRTTTLEEKKEEADQQAAMAQLGQLQGMDPNGGEEPPEEEVPEEAPTGNAKLAVLILNRLKNTKKSKIDYR